MLNADALIKEDIQHSIKAAEAVLAMDMSPSRELQRRDVEDCLADAREAMLTLAYASSAQPIRGIKVRLEQVTEELKLAIAQANDRMPLKNEQQETFTIIDASDSIADSIDSDNKNINIEDDNTTLERVKLQLEASLASSDLESKRADSAIAQLTTLNEKLRLREEQIERLLGVLQESEATRAVLQEQRDEARLEAATLRGKEREVKDLKKSYEILITDLKAENELLRSRTTVPSSGSSPESAVSRSRSHTVPSSLSSTIDIISRKTKSKGGNDADITRPQKGFRVRILTADKVFAGTTSQAFVDIIGRSDHTGDVPLTGGKFDRHSIDDFWLTEVDNEAIGAVSAVRLSIIPKGWSPSWLVDRVIITDLSSCEQWTFMCGQWLDKESKLYRELLPEVCADDGKGVLGAADALSVREEQLKRAMSALRTAEQRVAEVDLERQEAIRQAQSLFFQVKEQQEIKKQLVEANSKVNMLAAQLRTIEDNSSDLEDVKTALDLQKQINSKLLEKLREALSKIPPNNEDGCEGSRSRVTSSASLVSVDMDASVDERDTSFSPDEIVDNYRSLDVN